MEDIILLTSDSKNEKENTFKESIVAIKCKYGEIKNVLEQKKPKMISAAVPRDHVELCKAAVSEYNKRKSELIAMKLDIDIKFLENDSNAIAAKVSNIAAANSKLTSCIMLGEDEEGCMVEMEALYKSFLTARSAAISNIQRAREMGQEKAKRVAAAKYEAEEIARKQKAQSEAEEAKRKAEEAILISVAKQAELEDTCTVPKNNAVLTPRAAANDIEEGEISVQQQLLDMAELAASFALELEEFGPRLKPLQEYSTASFKYMRAQCRTAMISNNEIVESRQNRDTNIRWNGPRFLTRLPRHVPLFYSALERLREQRQ